MTPAPWSGNGGGIKQFEEAKMEVEAGTQVQVTVFGNRLRESCSPGG